MNMPGPGGSAAATSRVPTVEVLVHGDFDAWSAPRINDTIVEAMALQPQLLIIDLADCPSIDAAGIILLLDVHRRAISNGSLVSLRSPSPRLRRNLRLAHLDRVLTIISSPADPTAAVAVDGGSRPGDTL